MRKPIEKFKQIDNPGGGDCAFYAFAIDLIDYLATHKNNAAVIEKMGLNLNGIKYLEDNVQKYKKEKRFNKEFLADIKQLMRELLIEKYIEDCHKTLLRAFENPITRDMTEAQKKEKRTSQETYIKNNRLYTFFAQMVQQKTTIVGIHRAFDILGIGNEVSNHVVQEYNPLYGNRQTEMMVTCVANHIKEIRKTSYYLNLDIAQQQALEDSLIIQAFLKNITGSDNFNNIPLRISHNSSIINHIKYKLAQSNWWGTEEDLLMLAEHFNFEVIFWRNNEPAYFNEEFPKNAIHLMNKNRGHWVSLLPINPESGVILNEITSLESHANADSKEKFSTLKICGDEEGAKKQIFLTVQAHTVWQIVGLYMVISGNLDKKYLDSYVRKLQQEYPEEKSPKQMLRKMGKSVKQKFHQQDDSYQFSLWMPAEQSSKYIEFMESETQIKIRQALVEQLMKYQVAWYDPRQFFRNHIWRVDEWISQLEHGVSLVNVERSIRDYISLNDVLINRNGLFKKVMADYASIKKDILGSSNERELTIRANNC